MISTMRDIMHVIPNNDLREHTEDGLVCGCNPEVQVRDDCYIVVHNAYDGREWDELRNLNLQ
jgi:hypothetical protein